MFAFRLATARRWTSSVSDVVRQLQALSGRSTVPTALRAMQLYPQDVEVHRAGLQALSKYDADDTATSDVVAGYTTDEGQRVFGTAAITAALENHIADPVIAGECLRLIANMCWVTLTDASAASNQALLGADGAVHLAAQALHKHGREDERVCERALHALLLLTMYNKQNVQEAINYDVVNLAVAMLGTHPASLAVQDTGLALLLRILNAPLENSAKADYMYEEDPLTAASLFVTAAKNHPVTSIHEKVWHGLCLLAHNHATLPHLARLLAPPTLDSMIEQLSIAALNSDEEMPVRGQMLQHASSVVATLLEGDTADAPTTALTKGDFAKVAIMALNKGVEDEQSHALRSVLLALSGREDPMLQDESTMATLLTSISGDIPHDSLKVTLKTLWNMLNFRESQLHFVTLGGPSIVKNLPALDEETQKLVQDLLLKVRNLIEG